MFGIIKESFKITNNYISIATPLILFSLISSLYLLFSSGGSKFGLIFTLFLFFLMTGAFLAGWFYMITKAIKTPENNENNSLISDFPAGVGEYFLSILGLLLNSFIISTVIIIAVILAGKKLIGSPDISYIQILNATESVETMKTLVSSLSNEQLVKINAWNLLLLLAFSFNYFIIMFYAPSLFFKRKNPFISIFIAIKDLFCRHFFKNIALYVLIITSYFCLTILSALIGTNIFIHFILTLINFYYITFITILIFNYYYSNYAKVGSTIDKMV